MAAREHRRHRALRALGERQHEVPDAGRQHRLPQSGHRRGLGRHRLQRRVCRSRDDGRHAGIAGDLRLSAKDPGRDAAAARHDAAAAGRVGPLHRASGR